MQFDYFPNVKRLNKRQKQFIIPRVLKELTKDVERWVKDGEIEYVLPLKLYKDRYGYAVVDQEESWVSQLTRCPRCGCIDHDITLGEGDIYVCWCGLTISGDRSFVESSMECFEDEFWNNFGTDRDIEPFLPKGYYT